MTSTKAYTPKPGSKVATAVAALLDGPMNTTDLGKAMDANPTSVNAMLMTALEHGSIVKLKDESGLLHFSLGGMPVDERFTAHDSRPGTSRNALGRDLTASPLIRKVSSHAAPSADALTAANPFRRTIQPPPPSDTSSVKSVRAKRTPEQPSDTAPNGFVAGLLSNGELMIKAGTESITLSTDHTRQLFNYLDQVQEPIRRIA